MNFTIKQIALSSIAALLALGVAWVWKLNSAMKQTPPEVLAVSPHRWTDQEIRDTYQRIKANPINWAKHLPPKPDRRYIVTGGSGGVGGQIIMHLLTRGHPPESIRIVDFRAPDRASDTDAAARVNYAHADITSAHATRAAFARPWPPGVAALPLTVFHTAAVITASERSPRTYDRVARVNVRGTQNVVSAARAVRASVFVLTSSGSVAYAPVQHWGGPLRPGGFPRNYWQAVDESDFDRPLREHRGYFCNYARAKAEAERIVAEADQPGFRTGIVRPANAVYGGAGRGDQAVGWCLRAGTFPSWIRNVVQNFVHAGHVSLAHLLFEAALLSDGGGSKATAPLCAGRPFVVTDVGPPPMFDDMYRLLRITAETPPIKVVYVQPALMLILAHVVEWFDIASRLPVLEWIVPRPRGDLAILQPAVFSASTHNLASDAAARRSVDEGGIGYKPVYTSIEGFCQQVLDWNIEHRGSEEKGPQSAAQTLVKEIRNVGTVPAAIGA
ncbi:NAD(P)-binding protein [Hypoxylon sp. NC1633]|nr:NAD(P)-binding protein [Hypoxylon sp. NC1633]